MLAIPARDLARQTEQITHVANLAEALCVVTLIAIASSLSPRRNNRDLGNGLTFHPNNSASRAPVQRSRRASHHFHTTGRRELQSVNLPLPIGQSGGNPVDQKSNTPNTEAGSGTKASNRNAKVLGKILSTLRKNTWHRHERLTQCELLTRKLNGLLVHHTHGRWHLKYGLGHTLCAHNNLFNRIHLGAGECLITLKVYVLMGFGRNLYGRNWGDLTARGPFGQDEEQAEHAEQRRPQRAEGAGASVVSLPDGHGDGRVR